MSTDLRDLVWNRIEQDWVEAAYAEGTVELRHCLPDFNPPAQEWVDERELVHSFLLCSTFTNAEGHETRCLYKGFSHKASGLFHGRGLLIDEGGFIYEGYFKHGKLHGPARSIFYGGYSLSFYEEGNQHGFYMTDLEHYTKEGMMANNQSHEIVQTLWKLDRTVEYMRWISPEEFNSAYGEQFVEQQQRRPTWFARAVESHKKSYRLRHGESEEPQSPGFEERKFDRRSSSTTNERKVSLEEQPQAVEPSWEPETVRVQEPPADSWVECQLRSIAYLSQSGPSEEDLRSAVTDDGTDMTRWLWDGPADPDEEIQELAIFKNEIEI